MGWGYDKLAQEAWDFGPARPTLAELEGCGLRLPQARPRGLGFGPAGPTLADVKDVVWGHNKLALEGWGLDLADLL